MIEINSNKKVDLEISGRNKKFKIALKHWTGTIIIGVFAVTVIFGLLRGREFLANFLLSREQERIQKELERPYREDKYGGKTPEETFDMFLDALKKGDIELASKYFILKKQDDWETLFNQYKNENIFEDFVKELEKNRQEWKLIKNNGQEAEFQYLVIVKKETTTKFGDQILNVPPGTYKNSITFQKNQFTKLWKIVGI